MKFVPRSTSFAQDSVTTRATLLMRTTDNGIEWEHPSVKPWLALLHLVGNRVGELQR